MAVLESPEHFFVFEIVHHDRAIERRGRNALRCSNFYDICDIVAVELDRVSDLRITGVRGQVPLSEHVV